jgi:Flp pilus assembly protein TadB
MGAESLDAQLEPLAQLLLLIIFLIVVAVASAYILVKAAARRNERRHHKLSSSRRTKHTGINLLRSEDSDAAPQPARERSGRTSGRRRTNPGIDILKRPEEPRGGGDTDPPA